MLERLEADELLDAIADARAVARYDERHRWWMSWLERNANRWRLAGGDHAHFARDASSKSAGVRSAVVQAAWEAPPGHPARALAPAGYAGLGKRLLMRRPPEALISETRYDLNDASASFIHVACRPCGGLVACDDQGRVLLFSPLGRMLCAWALGDERFTGLAVAGDIAYATGTADGVHVLRLNASDSAPGLIGLGAAPVSVYKWPGGDAVVALDVEGLAHRIADAVVTGSVATSHRASSEDVEGVVAPDGNGLVVFDRGRSRRSVWIEASSAVPVVRSDSEQPAHPDGEAMRAGLADVCGPLRDGVRQPVPVAWGARAADNYCEVIWRLPDGRELASGSLDFDLKMEGCWPIEQAGLFLLWGGGEVLLFDTVLENGDAAEADRGVRDRCLWSRKVPDVKVLAHGDRLILAGSQGVSEFRIAELARLRGGPRVPERFQRVLCCWRSSEATTALVATADGSLVATSATGFERRNGGVFWKGGFAVSGPLLLIWRQDAVYLAGQDAVYLAGQKVQPLRPDGLPNNASSRGRSVIAALPSGSPGTFIVILQDGKVLSVSGDPLKSSNVCDASRPVRQALRVGGCLLLETDEGKLLQLLNNVELVPIDIPLGGRLIPSPGLSALAVVADGGVWTLAPGEPGVLAVRRLPADDAYPVHWANETTLCQIRTVSPGVLEVLLFERDSAGSAGDWQTRRLDQLRTHPRWGSIVGPAQASRVDRRRDLDGDWCVVWFDGEWIVAWNIEDGTVFNPAQPVAHEAQLPPSFRLDGASNSLGSSWIAPSENDTALVVGRGEASSTVWQGEHRLTPLALLRGGVAVAAEGGQLVILHPVDGEWKDDANAAVEDASFRLSYSSATRLA